MQWRRCAHSCDPGRYALTMDVESIGAPTAAHGLD
jgi:hypothetical protein